ncbi:DUF4232 domain-containing protein [Streptomyces sp. NPDC017529]|uniref:DUF4232 domain-containing protein n=1 Tax=Streptomyces sp. NPDC017529 TaxID=3365000 RepID=UPI0037B353E8
MRKRPLIAAALAALFVSGGLVACDEPRVDALQASCATKDLKWQVTVLEKKSGSLHRDGRLSAVNTGGHECVFRGYPEFRVHVGKGPQADGVGHGRGRPVSLASGAGVVVDLRYRDAEKGAPYPADCLVSSGHAVVAAPRDADHGTAAPVRDEKGEEVDMDVCDDVVHMGPPRAAAG